jgi:Capsule assembly protein Wzi
MKGLVHMIVFILILASANSQSVYNLYGPNQLRDLPGDSMNATVINPHQMDLKLIDSFTKSKRLEFKYKAFSARFNPFSFQINTNSSIPANYTANFMMPNVGVQKVISAGVHIDYKDILEFNFQPIKHSIDNLPFDQYPPYSNEWPWYYYYLNRIDLPARFSNVPFKRNLLGPSYLKFKYKRWALTFSNENKWWGPANFNPLVLGSNAPGFLHASIRPINGIRTSIGKFDAEVLIGMLYKSGFYPIDTNRVNRYTAERLYKPKIDDDRFLNGIVYTYQPKWVSGLTLGFTKLSMVYKNELKNPIDAIPICGFFGNRMTNLERQGKKASMGSWFMRYVMPKSLAEIYFEYGRGDQSLHVWNILQEKPYSRGFTAGLKKAYELNRYPGHFIQFGTELTNLSLPSREQVKNQDPKSWYIDDYIRQGFTHKGVVLGSQLGPGSNGQNLYIQYLHGLNKIGVRFTRTIHNLDYYHYTGYYLSNHFNQYWASLATLIYSTWHFRNFSVNMIYGMQRDLNYQWDWVRYTDVGFENVGNDKYNISLNLMLTYRL